MNGDLKRFMIKLGVSVFARDEDDARELGDELREALQDVTGRGQAITIVMAVEEDR